MAIYEISHIYDKKYFRKDRTIIMVGYNKYEDVLCEQNMMDNITEKNPNYCELTAIYALHKNTMDSFYGIEHYRRCFCDSYGNMLSEKKSKRIIEKGKIILPIRCTMMSNNYLSYSMHHYQKDLEVVRDIIMQDYKEYAKTFDLVMCSNKMSCFNMIMCSGEIFHSYCTWLFEILGKCENKIDVNSYSLYQARVFGFLSERLLNVWIIKNIPKHNIVYREVMQTDADPKSNIKVFLKTIISNLYKG